MKRFLPLILVVIALCSCTFHVKTPLVANYKKLNQSDILDMNKTDIEMMLGEPQGTGIHRLEGVNYDLVFYSGFAGIFTFTSARYDSGTVLVSFEGDDPANVIYFTSSLYGPEISFKKNLPIKQLAEQLILGQSNIKTAYEVLGTPDFTGKRMNKKTGITHSLAYWDSSQIQTDGAIKEKWIMLGFDSGNVVQDLVWVSSFPEDIASFGSIEPDQLKQISRLTMAGFFPIREPVAMLSSKKIDPVQVDAMLKKNISNIAEIESVLGKPTAVGIKTFELETPMILSNWTHSKVEMKGTEHTFVPPGASDIEREKLRSDKSYMVMDITQSRLMVGHDDHGIVRELMWYKPVRR